MRRTLIALVLLAVGCGSAVTKAPVAAVRFETDRGEFRVAPLRAADTWEARRQGLMGVAHLPEDDGMLFVFDEATQGSFWMKDTLIPLDIAFWDADGRIHTITRMEPCDLGTDCPSYVPDEPYLFALEMNAGWFAEHGVEVGDRADGRLLTP